MRIYNYSTPTSINTSGNIVFSFSHNYLLLFFFSRTDVGPVSVTYDPKVIMYRLNQLTISGGGDCPEMSITAVVQALKAVKPNSYVYVFTDASPKDTHLVYEALELVQRKQTQVIFNGYQS